MLHCHLQVLLCTEIALQEDSPLISLLKETREGGGLKKFSRLAIAGHILRPLINYDVIQALPQTCEGFSDPFLTPLDTFSISILGELGASSLVPHFSDQSYAPGGAPGLPPAKSGPGGC